MRTLNSNMNSMRASLTAMLVGHAAVIASLNRGGMHDWARNAEFFLAEIAHLLFDQPFDVADTIKSNHPIYDLHGADTVVQVTSQLKPEKILNDLRAWRAEPRSRRLYFFLIGEKPKYSKETLKKLNALDFDPADIWGGHEVIERCCAGGIEMMAAACDIARKHLLLEDPSSSLNRSEILDRLASFLSEVLAAQKAKKSLYATNPARFGRDEPAQNYNQFMSLFVRDTNRICDTLGALHKAVVEHGFPMHQIARDSYHRLRFDFLYQMAKFDDALDHAQETIELKAAIDDIERLNAEKAAIETQLQALQTEREEIDREISSMEFAMRFMQF
ncbi:hypothetical protein [Pseudomonas alloputida]